MAVNRHSYVGFYPSDWLAGTARMTRTHKSIYFDVCCYIWDQNRPCPVAELPLMLGDIHNWRDLVEDLVEAGKLVRGADGSLCNERAISEAQKAFSLWEKKSQGGKRGAAKTNTPGGSGDRSPAGSGDGSSPKTAGTPDAEPEPEPEPTLEDDVEGAGEIAKSDPFGHVEQVTAKILRAGGVSAPPSRHAKLAAQQDIVRGWLATGLTEAELLQAIEQRVLDQPEERHSLNRFSPMIADIAARKDAQANGKVRGNGATPTRSRNGFTNAIREARALREAGATDDA